MASFMASLSVAVPEVTGTTSALDLHAEDIRRLAPNVFDAHEDMAFHAEKARHRGCGDAVLARARFGDDPAFPHPPREKGLAEGVVELVRACVVQVLPFQIDLGAAQCSVRRLAK